MAEIKRDAAVKLLDRGKMIWVSGGLFLLLLLSIIGCALLGSVPIDFYQLFHSSSSNPDVDILFRARLPRVLLGVAVGGGLASCGVVLQAMLRNPLACP